MVAGIVLTLAAGARRTASAPDRYTAASGGDPELVVMQPSGEPLTDAVRQLPGVAAVQAVTFVPAFPFRDGTLIDLNPFAGDDRRLGGRLVEGRFTDPTRPDEFTVNVAGFVVLGGEVGERFEFDSFSQPQTDGNEFRPDVALEGPSFEATLVGVVSTPSDLEDPAPVLIFSEALLAEQPEMGVVATFMVVDADDGVVPAAILAAIQRLPGGEGVFEDASSVVGPGTRRAIHLQVNALWIITVIAAVVGALVIGQLVTRHLRVATAERDALRALGYGRTLATAEAALTGGIAGALASIVAVVIAIAASRLFPIGVLRAVEPEPGVSIDRTGLLAGAAMVTAICALVAATSALRDAEPVDEATPGRARLSETAALAGASPTMALGVHFAVGSPGRGRTRAVVVAATVALAVAGVAGALLVGVSLRHMTAEPRLWNADVDHAFGNPFVPADRDIVTPAVEDPDVVAVTAATIGSLTLDGVDVGVFAFDAVRGGLLPAILEGRAPSAVDEVALGRVVADDLGLDVGDNVTARGPDGEAIELQVVGLAVSPSEAGDGVVMDFDGYQSLVADATRNVVVVRFRDGAPPGAAARVSGTEGTAPSALTPPTSVLAFERVVPAPFVLAIVLAAMVVTALAYQLASTVYVRRRDLAVLRALGADGRQLRSTIHWQAFCVAGFGLVVGIPAGLAAGRWVHKAIADGVGVVPILRVPVVVVLAVIVGVVAVANVAALVPARRAARAPAGQQLREG